MAHFAKLNDNNIVTEVIVLDNNILLDENNVEQEQLGIEYCQSLFGGIWQQTSYNSNIKGTYAGVGYKYDEQLDRFIPPQPYPSWVLNEDYTWNAPIPCPEVDGTTGYVWDEKTISWKDSGIKPDWSLSL